MANAQMDDGNLLQKLCREVGLTRPMIRKITGMSERDVDLAVANDRIIGYVSRLFRHFGVKFTLPISSGARFTFSVASLAKQAVSQNWRDRHDLLRWPKDAMQRNRMIQNMRRVQSAAEVSAVLNSQLIPGPENGWSANSVYRAFANEPVAFLERSDADKARFVINRELTDAFASPKLPEYTRIDTSGDPVKLEILPCPVPVFRWLTSAAIAIEGFELQRENPEKSDANEPDEGSDIPVAASR